MISRLAGIALTALLSSAMPAMATGTIECTQPDGEVTVDLAIGTLPILSVLRATIETEDRRWATDNNDDDLITVGQQFGDADSIRVDFVDPNVVGIVAELRLVQALEERSQAMAGTLRIEDVGAWPLICTGP